jgi:SAM-dependent methyltransferase
MRRLIKSALNRVPLSRKIVNSHRFYNFINRLDALRSGSKLKSGNLQDIFTDYYRENYWENDESLSGDGSTLAYTENLRRELPALLEKFEIQSILDAPCGDYNWFRFVERGAGVRYIGADVVEDLIRRNREKYAGPDTDFIKLDITRDRLPAADLWMCRDVLFHFSFRDVFLSLQNFLRSDIKFLLATSHTECAANADILSGQFRLLNLELEPFNLPAPIAGIDDWIEGFPIRKMCLWRREAVAEALAANENFLDAPATTDGQ